MNRNISILLLLVIALVLSTIYILKVRWAVPQWESAGSLKIKPSTIDAYDLYDLGVAKIDQDSFLDVFTVNHSARQVFVSGDSGPQFLYDIGLGQDSNFPGLDAAVNNNPPTQPGIYILRKKKNLSVEIIGDVPVSFPVVIEFKLPWPWQIISNSKASVTLNPREADNQSEAGQHIATLTLEKRGKVLLIGKQEILELPHSVTVQSESALPYVKIGAQFITPSNSSFTLEWRDRHSMAWHDLNNDDVMDVFIGRGGVKGQMDKVGVKINDEILVRREQGVVDVADEVGLVKSNCPGRQAAWVDINTDGILDLYASCGRGAGGHFPDQVYIYEQGQGFKDQANALRLDNPGVSVFRWLDVDGDGDSDQLLYNGKDLVLNTNTRGSFSATTLMKELKSKPTHIVLADVDGDLDLDAFVVKRKASLLLINKSGTLQIEKPEVLGLPSSLRAGAFLDVNLDGKLDFHAVPGGLYLGGDDGYQRSAELEDNTVLQSLSSARCAWYDKESNGDMDVLCAFERYPKKEIRIWKKLVKKQLNTRSWSMYAAEYQGTSDQNWLQFDLRGDVGNREALGAHVTVSTTAGKQRRYVGQFETSHFSQGHYRLYFGLGDKKQVESVIVEWPDLSTQTVDIKRVNQLVVVQKSTGVN